MCVCVCGTRGKTVCLTRWFSKSAGQLALKPTSYKSSFTGSVTLSEWKTTGFRSKSSSANWQQESAWQADHYNDTKTAWRSTLEGVHLTLNSSVWTPSIGLAGGPRAELQSRSLKLLASRHYKTKELSASKLFILEHGHVHHVLAFVHLASDSLPIWRSIRNKAIRRLRRCSPCVCVCLFHCAFVFLMCSQYTIYILFCLNPRQQRIMELWPFQLCLLGSCF